MPWLFLKLLKSSMHRRPFEGGPYRTVAHPALDVITKNELFPPKTGSRILILTLMKAMWNIGLG